MNPNSSTLPSSYSNAFYDIEKAITLSEERQS